MPKSYRFGLLWMVLVGLCCDRSQAWVATGHKVVAFIAWEDLSAKTQSAVTDLLKHHVRYQQDLQRFMPEGLAPLEQARSVFAAAATWPDVIRSAANPMYHSANHPAWHYLDIPFATGGVTVDEKPPAGPPPHNIVEALTQTASELRDPAVPNSQRAIDLCWVEHLVGDIHQPLHAASWFSPQFPRGDQGGGDEMVLKTPPFADSAETLHFLWDSLAGDFDSEELMRFEATGLRSDPHYSREAFKSDLAVTGYMDWANQSHDLAVKYAYLDGTLHFAPAHHGKSESLPPGVPAGYVDQAEHVAMRQLSLGGYRLADLLNSIFDPK